MGRSEQVSRSTTLGLVLLLGLTSLARAQDVPPDVEQFDAHASTHYRIYDQDGVDSAWAPAVARVLECAREHFDEIWRDKGFVLEPAAEPLVWLRFAERDSFVRYARSVDDIDMSWAEGYYSARTHRVAVFSREGERERASAPAASTHSPSKSGVYASSPGTGEATASALDDLPRLTHEAAHQLAFNNGLLERGVMYPIWVSEGLAMHFEADASGRLGTGAQHEQRRQRLAEAAQDGRLVSLSRFLVLTRIPSDDPRATEAVYDQGWGVFALLLEERPEALRAYLAALSQKQPGRRSESTLREEIESAFGDLAPLEVAWERFVERASTAASVDPSSRICN